LCNNPDTLAWLAQLANIEVHTWFSRTTPLRRAERAGTAGTAFATSEQALRDSTLNRPDYVVFDVDPYLFPDNKLPQRKGEKDPDYSRRGFDAAVEAALLLRDVLKRLKLDGFVKTSGKTGLHLFVPIVRRYTFEQTHAFAKTVTQYLEGLHPGKVTTAWAAEQRVGKVFLDYNQNRLGAMADPILNRHGKLGHRLAVLRDKKDGIVPEAVRSARGGGDLPFTDPFKRTRRALRCGHGHHRTVPGGA